MNGSPNLELQAANRLIQVCRECESALRTAADVAESAELRERYRERAAIWARFCTALQSEIEECGVLPPESSGIAVALRRAWIKIKSAIGDVDAIASECVMREREAIHQCERAVKQGMTPSLETVVRRFSAQISERQMGDPD